MKLNKNISIAILAGITLCSPSCKNFLDRVPPSSLKEELISNKKGINALLVGAYGALDGQDFTDGDMTNLSGGAGYAVSPDNWIYGSVCGGDAHKGSDHFDSPPTLDLARFTAGATNSFLNDKWRVDYEGVTRCNTVLRLLPKVTDMTDEEKTEVAAEAHFLRGHYYSDLKKMFNMVPWIDETTTDMKTPNNKDIWPEIEADFKFGMDNLASTQTEVGRPNKWAAACYLAKTYMFEHKYTDAKPLFDQIISQGITSKGERYKLRDRFEDNFDAATENTSECVFAIQYDANDNSGTSANANQGEMLNYPYNGPFSCCGFFQPTQDLVNSYITNAQGLPYLDDYNSHSITTETLDPRLDWTVGRQGIPYLDWGVHPGDTWIREASTAGHYSPKKNVYWQATQDKYYDPRGWAPGNAINYNLIRYADVLLMAAECEAQLSNLDQAQAYVDTVRGRAARPESEVYLYLDNNAPMSGFQDVPAANYKVSRYPTGTFTAQGKDYALKAIYFERKLELAMEGHRFFDLVRWGDAGDVLNAFFAFEGNLTLDIQGASFTKNKNEYFAIPQRQIDLSTNGSKSTLEQNKGYH
ncbi:Starch-binding associating with outer membrane [Chitinophaga sp. CF118]|uniref:RagB/SusD family nutrient uptake outer membrane protein n=1 Tax=Chitinophaga sp. CF118 TaxID=1884367 RepID=UPI0008EAD209|nr:RagB/SusD family nutrient uptake outer membrane protein [Chitinophaga sp. CF118]SFE55162.1 Starch-binding associating with outer membrane [Chitinophaga sp. CF118]